MPRTTPNRTIGGDRTVARRVAEEREARGWTLEVLSRRMEEAGCPIHLTALHKLEKGRPQRRVTVDELVAFSNVFEVAVEDLITPSEITRDLRLRSLVAAWVDARAGQAAANLREKEARDAIGRHLADHPEGAADIADLLRDSLEPGGDALPEGAVAEFWALRLRGVPDNDPAWDAWSQRVQSWSEQASTKSEDSE
jgi:transcriptional regulator with XRE-family HTH domain